MNSVCLSGTIKTQIKCTYTQRGACRASFILAVPRRSSQTNTKCSPRGQPGEIMLRIVAWDEQGEKARDFGAVGERVEVEGWIDVWKDRAGAWQTDIKAERINFPDRHPPVRVNEEVKKDECNA